MLIQWRNRTFFRCLFAFMLALIVAGCGGGNNSGSEKEPGPAAPTDTTPKENVFIEAHVGPIVALRVGEVATLDGRKSLTSSKEALTFAWSFNSKPDGSQAELENATSAQPTFTADVAGAYAVQLVVTAGGFSSDRAIEIVEATNEGDRPTGVYNHEGLSSNCWNCHNNKFDTTVEKSPDHLATSNVCQACHSTFGFEKISFVDHLEVFGKCSECHNGVLAIGKSEFHVETTQECDVCHNTTHFFELQPDGSFDHSGITGACSICHNGTTATGKSSAPAHPDTNSECNACHTIKTFSTPFVDHSGPDVVGHSCGGECHNGVIATGQTPDHPDTTGVECDTCHSTATFDLGGIFDHSVVDSKTLPCANCHNDVTAKGKPQDHIATDVDCANCHNTVSFVGGFVDHSGPEVVGKRCDSCHGVTSVGKSTTHIPTDEDCSVCHTPGTFSSGVFDHSTHTVDGICATCHDGVKSGGKQVGHIPTTEDCGACHTTDTFKGAVFDHSGVDTNDCASCHNGETSTGKPTNHVATNEDCHFCHLPGNYDTFVLDTFTHPVQMPDTCASCHNGTISTGKKANHIPTVDDCGACHSTDVFTGATYDHTGVTQGCEGCHNGKFTTATITVDGKPTDHVPTNQDCQLCHTTSAFSPASNFNHTGITNNCVSCHDGQHNISTGVIPGKTANHPASSDNCEECHNTTNFADSFVDHTSPEVLNARCDSCHNGTDAIGKNDGHVPTTEDCGLCHEAGGSFAKAVFNHDGIVDNCASCHNGTDATGKDPVTHIATTEDCSVCHNTTAFAGAKFDHTGITSNCASCHNNVSAIGKPSDHVPTNSDCSECHQTTGFLPATFDHQGIVDNCGACHDGVLATGKPDTHLPTSQDCGVCHTTTTFKGAVFDHTGIVDNCASCHDGVTATGKDAKKNPAHLATDLDCHFCHTTATFVGGSWTHDPATSKGVCNTCHNGTDATGQPPTGPNGHFDTSEQCDVCHTTTGWAPTTNFTHTTSDYPGDHNSNVTCKSCHTDNSEVITSYRNSTYKGYCAACHEKDYSSGDHDGRSVSTNKDCGDCHRVSSRSF